MSFSLGMYTIRLEKTTHGNVEDLDLENNEYSISVSNIVIDFITKEAINITSESTRKYLSNKQVFENTNKKITGVFRSGHYGVEKDVENIETGKKTYTISTKESETLPFYFYVNFSRKKVTQYYIIISRIDNFGIKEVFEKSLNSFLKIQNNIRGLNLKLNNLVPEEAFKQAKKNIKQMIFVKHEVPSDYAEFLKNNGAIPSEYEAQIIIKPKKKGRNIPFSDWGKVFKKGFRSKELIEVKNKDLAYDELNIKVKTGKDNNPKIYKLDSPEKYKGYFDISDKVSKLDNGHPNMNQLKKVADEYMKEIIGAMAVKEE